MAEMHERDGAGRERRGEPQARDKSEMTRLIERELDRWMEQRREIVRERRRRAAWNQMAAPTRESTDEP